jgi:hypothetical protein
VWGHNVGVGGSGVHGTASIGPQAAGVVGEHIITDAAGMGVHGKVHSSSGTGVKGEGPAQATGVRGQTDTGIGVHGLTAGTGSGTGVFAQSQSGWALEAQTTRGLAGIFFGPVMVWGDLTVENGNKPFKIDHPLYPQNKYLLHNAVESPERKNVYDGVAQLDEDGTASVDLPEWFEALNEDFRYQLTAVGQAAPNLHVAEKIYENNRFRIAGGEGGMEVCWQVTGTRRDPWAAANPFVVEEDKPQEERGRFLEPSLYGAPEEQSVMRARMGEDRWQRMMREEPPSFEPPQAPPTPTSFEPPQPPVMPPQAPELEEHRQQIDELRGQIEELRRGRMEDEIDELRRQIKKLRRRRKR